MEIYRREGARLSLTNISRTAKDEDGTGRSAACRDAGPECDSYAADPKRRRKEAETAHPRKFWLAHMHTRKFC